MPYPLAIICCLAFGDGHPTKVGEAGEMKDILVYVVFEDDFADAVNNTMNNNTRVMIKEEAAILYYSNNYLIDILII